MKRTLCVILSFALLFCAVPAATAAGSAPVAFTDISDADTLRAANLLAALGIVSGVGGTSYDPAGTFSRAHLAVIGCRLSGVTDVSIYTGTVKFPDVRAGYWAHGWIMAALDHGIIVGDSDGMFNPENPMLYGYLVTVLMKLLGYIDADVGLNWPTSFIKKAEALGLSKGMSFGAYDVLTRGQAARLIYNFLFLFPKDGTKTFLETKLKAGYLDVMLRVVTADGADYADVGGVRYPLKAYVDKSLSGHTGKLLVDKDDNVLGFDPDPSYSYTSLTVQEARAASVVPAGSGGSVTVLPDTKIYPGTNTYGDDWVEILPGETLLLAYKGANLAYIYREGLTGLSGGITAVLTSQPSSSPIAGMFGGVAASARVVKNGFVTTWQTLEKWDVLTYYAQQNVVMVSNIRFVGHYSAGSPNAAFPTTITVQGKTFSLLAPASAKMESVALGSRRVFLLDHNGKIADVRPTDEVTAFQPVLVTKSGGYAAVGTVLLGNSVEFTAAMSFQGAGVIGQLCTMNNYSAGELYVSMLPLVPGTGDLNLGTMKMGTVPVAPWCEVYECVGAGGITRPLSLSEIPASAVPAGKILHAGIGPSGYVTTLLLSDVTAECYDYGVLRYEDKDVTVMGVATTQTFAWVENGAGDIIGDKLYVPSGVTLPEFGAIVGLSSRLGSTGDAILGQVVQCVANTGLTRYSFSGADSVLILGKSVPVAADSVLLPSGVTMTIPEARAYCSSFTAYTDPSGCKVRFITGK